PAREGRASRAGDRSRGRGGGRVPADAGSSRTRDRWRTLGRAWGATTTAASPGARGSSTHPARRVRERRPRAHAPTSSPDLEGRTAAAGQPGPRAHRFEPRRLHLVEGEHTVSGREPSLRVEAVERYV